MFCVIYKLYVLNKTICFDVYSDVFSAKVRANNLIVSAYKYAYFYINY